MAGKITSASLVTARYQETDQMGVIHHSVYPVWFEVGRTDLIKKAGLTYTDLERAGVLLPLVELACKYKSFARYEDELLVMTCVNEISYTRISFSYEVFLVRDKNKAIADGKTFHIFADRRLKPVNMRKYMPDMFERLKLGS